MPTTPTSAYTPTFWLILSGLVMNLGYMARSWINTRPAKIKADAEKLKVEAEREKTAAEEISMRSRELFADLRGQMTDQGKRITELEAEVRDERLQCGRQLLDMEDRHRAHVREIEARHRDEMQELKSQLRGMIDGVGQTLRSNDSLIELGKTIAPSSAERLKRPE